MQKRDTTKKSRFDRPSLMPPSAREREPEEPAHARPPPRTSWSPPTGGIVKARMLPEVEWEEYESQNFIPVASPPEGFIPPNTQHSIIPRAPLMPRIDVAPTIAPRVSDSPPRTSLMPPRMSMPPQPGTPPPRTTMAMPPRGSVAPARTSVALDPRTRSNDPWERLTLTPAMGVQSLVPGRYDAVASDEERLYTKALFLREQGRTSEAVQLLDDLVASSPEHAEARTLLLKLALEQGQLDKVEQHAEWVVLDCAQRLQNTQVCNFYRSARVGSPQQLWSERALLAVLIAADKSGEGRVVVDVTKMLLHTYGESPALPRALYASAAVQQHEGRPDLARATLQNLVARFPRDSLAPAARRRLHDIG